MTVELGANEPADTQLVALAKSGDKRAFDVLVRKYQFRVMKLVARYIRDNSEVLDVSQEVFVKAYIALPGFRGDSQFYTWLYRIAINTAKNYVIALGRKPHDVAIEGCELERGIGGMPLSEGATPERLLMRDEIEAVVLKAIEHLPKELRTAITLREMDGLSYEEISTIMDCPIGTVRSRIFRARELIDAKVKPLMK